MLPPLPIPAPLRLYGDGDVPNLAAFAAAADTRASGKNGAFRIAAVCFHCCIAADLDGAGNFAFVAASDTGRARAALGGYIRAAVYLDDADASFHHVVIAVADARTFRTAGGIYDAAGNGDAAAGGIPGHFTATDACGVLAAPGRHVAAGNDNIAAGNTVLVPAAYARALVTAGGVYSAAVDGDSAVFLCVVEIGTDAAATADTRGPFSALSRYASAVYCDIAVDVNAGIALDTADTGMTCLNSADSTGNQRAGARDLPINGQAVAAGDGDAPCGVQRAVVCQDQVYVTADCDAVSYINSAFRYVPSVSPFGIIGGNVCGTGARLRSAVSVNVRHRVIRGGSDSKQ